MARTINMLEAINEALSQEMERDERVFILGEDIGLSGGVFKVTDGLLDKFGEERVLDTPLADLRSRLQGAGFAVRRGETFAGLGPGWIRVAVRDAETSERFASALREVIGVDHPS